MAARRLCRHGVSRLCAVCPGDFLHQPLSARSGAADADLHDAGLRPEHVVGLAGLLDLGYVAFYAVGAYSYALIAQTFGLSFWICLPLAGIFAAFAGVLLGFPVLRLRGDYLAIVTLGFGEIIRLVLLNWQTSPAGRTAFPAFRGRHSSACRLTDRRRWLRRDLRPDLFADPPLGFSLLLDPGAGAADQLGHAAAAAAADRPRLGGFARGRNRLQGARHQHHDHQTHRVCHRRHVRRFCRRFLRHAAEFHQPGILHLRRIRAGARHRRARRHGHRSSASPWRPPSCSAAFEFFREFEQYRMLVFGAAMVAVMIFRPRGLGRARARRRSCCSRGPSPPAAPETKP